MLGSPLKNLGNGNECRLVDRQTSYWGVMGAHLYCAICASLFIFLARWGLEYKSVSAKAGKSFKNKFGTLNYRLVTVLASQVMSGRPCDPTRRDRNSFMSPTPCPYPKIPNEDKPRPAVQTRADEICLPPHLHPPLSPLTWLRASSPIHRYHNDVSASGSVIINAITVVRGGKRLFTVYSHRIAHLHRNPHLASASNWCRRCPGAHGGSMPRSAMPHRRR